MPETKVIICPYCGETQPAGDRCKSCGGFFEAPSRQATQNEMGPWFVRDPKRSFHPGCSYETVAKLVERGQITRYTVIRGPSTRQFWSVGRHVPGIAHLLGYCHACDAKVEPTDHGCAECGAQFGAYLDRNNLGLSDVRPLPGEAPDFHDHEPAGGGGNLTATRWPGPTGVSSFASDAQLFSAAPRTRPVNGHSSPPETNGETADSEAATNDIVMNPAVRSMQRRIARQQRTIRLLTVLVVVVAMAGAIMAVVITSAGGDRSGDPSPQQVLDDTIKVLKERVNPTGLTNVSTGSASDFASPESSADAPAVEDLPRDLDEENLAGFDDTEAIPPPAPNPYAIDLERVETLLGQASDDTRGTDDRIADYDEAMRLLRGVEANAPQEIRPADLAERIAAIEEELERLRLGAFFDPGA